MSSKILTHGFFTNSFNSETGRWELTRTGSDELVASGPKAAPLGVLGSAMTRAEKAQGKVFSLDFKLRAAEKAAAEAQIQLEEAFYLVDAGIGDDEEGTEEDGLDVEAPNVDELTRKQLLEMAKSMDIKGRHKLNKTALGRVIQAAWLHWWRRDRLPKV